MNIRKLGIILFFAGVALLIPVILTTLTIANEVILTILLVISLLSSLIGLYLLIK